jgi:hypothetical protein
MNFSIYIYIGLLVTLFMIWFHRRNGTPLQENELYWAALGPFLWPLQVMKWLVDRILERSTVKRDLEFYDWLSENLTTLNIEYDRYVASSLEVKRQQIDFHTWCRKQYTKRK